MSKSYEKPRVSKVEVDSQVIRMFTRQGFIDVFWEELSFRKKEIPDITREEVFDSLNKKFFEVFGEYRYGSYDSFRQRMNEKPTPNPSREGNQKRGT